MTIQSQTKEDGFWCTSEEDLWGEIEDDLRILIEDVEGAVFVAPAIKFYFK